MRIALVHMRHARSGGTERYLDQLSAFLAQREHEVTIVCRSHVEPAHAGVRFEVLRPLSFGGAWRMWSFARAVEQHVARVPYDLVFGLGKTWTQDVLRLGGGVQRTYLQLAHRATLEGWERWFGAGRLKQRVACAIEDRALAPGAAAKWIANSQMVRRDVLAHFALPQQDVVVVHNGVDVERFHPRLRDSEGRRLRAELGLAPDEIAVLFLGTGYGRKGLALLIDAFASVRTAKPRARLLVAGYDSALSHYRSLSRALGPSVRFLGGRNDAPACFAASDLYVLPTLYDPFANATLEALASGLPVITSDTNGASELITHGREGAVISLANGAGALRAELDGWLDRERIATARPHARALAEAHDQQRSMRETLAVLESARRYPARRRSPGAST